jgi:membrane fusion protein (multidrug efflux system)
MGLSPSRLTVVALALVLAACGSKAGTGQGGMNGPAQVGVVFVRTEPVALTTELSGRISAQEVSEVRPQVSGIVLQRLFQEGGLVRKGQPLYQIDPATYRAGLQSAQAGLAQAQAALDSARLKADRSRTLMASGYVSPQGNDDVQAAWRQAQANVSAQQANVAQARISLGYTRVLAPISGRIGKSSVTPGALVTAGQPGALATIQALDTVYVDVSQSSADLLKLRRDFASGQVGKAGAAQATLILEDGSTYPLTGRLAFSDVTVDTGTGSVGLRAIFPNPDGVLLPGMFARAVISKGVASAATLVPQAAVTRDPKGQGLVFVVGADGKAQQRVLTLGQAVGDKWLVTGGLAPGERLIVEGLQKVHPGDAVVARPISAQR